MREECRGCLTIVEYDCEYIFEKPDESKCPCSICIVKGMCEDMCDEFLHFQWPEIYGEPDT